LLLSQEIERVNVSHYFPSKTVILLQSLPLSL